MDNNNFKIDYQQRNDETNKNLKPIEAKRTKGEWKSRQISSEMLEIVTNEFNYSGKCICVLDADNEQSEANAAFICKAVNNYDSLLEALKRIESVYDWKTDLAGQVAHEAIQKAEQ